MQISLQKKSLNTSFKPVLKCTQVDNNSLQNISERSKLLKEKKTFGGILEIRCGTLVYSNNFFSCFQKLGVGDGGQLKNFFRPFWGEMKRSECIGVVTY